MKRMFFGAVLCLALTAASASPVSAQWEALSLTLRPTPCRILDTRVAGGPLIVNEIRVFSADPAFSSLQGGLDGCGVPSDARAVKVTVSSKAVSAAGGHLRVFNADGSALGTYATLLLAGPSQWVAVQGDVPVSGNLQVAIHAAYVSVDAVVDLVGWYH